MQWQKKCWVVHGIWHHLVVICLITPCEIWYRYVKISFFFVKYCTLLGVPWWDIDGQLILAPVDRLANARSGAGAGTSERRRELEVAGDTSYITSLSTIVRCIRATATVIVHTHTTCIHIYVYIIQFSWSCVSLETLIQTMEIQDGINMETCTCRQIKVINCRLHYLRVGSNNFTRNTIALLNRPELVGVR